MCAHPLCELVGANAGCSLAVDRSRGCHVSQWPRETAPEAVAEISALVRVVTTDPNAARRLAQIVRREMLEQRNVVPQLHDDDPELATAVARLIRPR